VPIGLALKEVSEKKYENYGFLAQLGNYEDPVNLSE